MSGAIKNLAAADKPSAERTRTIGAGYPRTLLDFAVSLGADRSLLLTQSGLDDTSLADQDNHVPLARYVSLLEAAAERTGRPDIALEFGKAVRIQEISVVGLVLEACETTGEVGAQLNRYASLVLDDGAIDATPLLRSTLAPDGVWIEGLHPVMAAHPKIAEAEFARLVWNARCTFAGSAEFLAMAFPAEVHFRHADPGYGRDYERIFEAPIVFNSRWNAMRVDARFGMLRHPPVNRYVAALLSERVAKLLNALNASRSQRARVEKFIMAHLHMGAVTMSSTAAQLGLSEQALYRALKAEGVTFESVLEQLRAKLALDFLTQRKISVNETAYLLGFSDPAAFSHAFKRWTGASPREYRASSLSQPR